MVVFEKSKKKDPTCSDENAHRGPTQYYLYFRKREMFSVNNEYKSFTQHFSLMVLLSKCDKKGSNPDLTYTPP